VVEEEVWTPSLPSSEGVEDSVVNPEVNKR